MAGAIEGIGNVARALDPPTRVRAENVRTDRREGTDDSGPRIQDSVTSRRIKDGVNAPGQMGPLSPAEHRIVEQVQKSLESASGPGQNGSDNPRGGRINILA